MHRQAGDPPQHVGPGRKHRRARRDPLGQRLGASGVDQDRPQRQPGPQRSRHHRIALCEDDRRFRGHRRSTSAKLPVAQPHEIGNPLIIGVVDADRAFSRDHGHGIESRVVRWNPPVASS